MQKRQEQLEPIAQIRQATRLLVRELDVVQNAYLGSEFSLTQCHVMFELAQQPGQNVRQLAETLLIDKSNVSRAAKRLTQLEMLQIASAPEDSRQKLFSLTAQGRKHLKQITSRATAQVQAALDNLDCEQQATVVQGMSLYANALRRSRLQADYHFRAIKKSDNPAMAEIIRHVMTEYGAVGEGYSIQDPEVDAMYQAYRERTSCYLVVAGADRVHGGGGIAPLAGGDQHTCELQKMFFLPSLRGIGIGYRLLDRLMEEAKTRGYCRCYLETLIRMDRAVALYQRYGFRPLTERLGDTGHDACDAYYVLDL